MTTVRIVPFPGVPGPTGATGPTGPVGETFPAPQSWTPVLSGVGFAQSSNPAVGSYTKHNNLVYVYGYIPFTNVTNFGSGQYSITLPFTSKNHSDGYGGTIHDTSSSGMHSVKFHLSANSNAATIWYSSGGNDLVMDFNSPLILATQDTLHFSFVYETAQ